MGGIIGIPVAKGRYVAVIDAEDADLVANYTWYAHKRNWGVYARAQLPTSPRGRFTYLHQLLIDCPSGFVVDHRNGDPLDNRKENLRICRSAENVRNHRKKPSQWAWKGYHRHADGRFRVQISVGDRTVHIGLCNNEIDAAKMYDEAALKYYGEFARLNFPRGGLQ